MKRLLILALLLTACVAWARPFSTGPRWGTGIGSGFSAPQRGGVIAAPNGPPSSGLIFLARRGDFTTSTGVNRWNDTSGLGNHAVQTVSTRQPSVAIDGAVEFGESDWLTLTTPITDTQGTILWSCPGDRNSITLSNYGMYVAGEHYPFICQIQNSWLYNAYFGGSNYSANIPPPTSPGVASSARIIAFTWQWDGANNTICAFFNGAKDTPITTVPEQPSWAPVSIKTLGGDALNDTWYCGKVYWYAFYNRVLSDAEIAACTTWGM